MSQALPLSPESRRQGARPGRSASLNRSQWTWAQESTPTSHRPSLRRTEQSLARNQSQISLCMEEKHGDREGTSIQRSASAFPLGSRGDSSARRRRSTEPFRPPPRQGLEESLGGPPRGLGSARAADSVQKGPQLTTASAAKRVVASLGRPAGTMKPMSKLDDWLEHTRRHRREAPMDESNRGFRPSAEDRAGVATHCWIQERKGSRWAGPPPPQRAMNRTLQRGTQALPSGPMSLRQEKPTSAEYGKAYTRLEIAAGVPTPQELNRAIANEGLFGRGTQALPRGPMMFLDGTTTHDYGKMYRKLD